MITRKESEKLVKEKKPSEVADMVFYEHNFRETRAKREEEMKKMWFIVGIILAFVAMGFISLTVVLIKYLVDYLA